MGGPKQTRLLIRLPHLLGPQLPSSDIQLHMIYDASQDVMATCIYFRYAGSSVIDIAFLIGRTDVSPLKQESTLKLESQFTLMGARLCKFASDETRLKLQSTHNCFSWTGSPGKLKTYCARNYCEIHTVCKAEQ